MRLLIRLLRGGNGVGLGWGMVSCGDMWSMYDVYYHLSLCSLPVVVASHTLCNRSSMTPEWETNEATVFATHHVLMLGVDLRDSG